MRKTDNINYNGYYNSNFNYNKLLLSNISTLNLLKYHHLKIKIKCIISNKSVMV